MWYSYVVALLISLGAVSYISPAEARNIPNAPSMSGSDRFRMDSNGSIQCESAVANSTAFQVGVYGNESDSEEYGHSHYKRLGDDKGVYASITMPLGKRRARIDCTRFADYALQKQTMEMEKLKLEHQVTMEALRNELNRLQMQTDSFVMPIKEDDEQIH